MKFDKDFVLKHKFWIILAVALPLTLISIFMLTTAVSGEIDQDREQILNLLGNFKKNAGEQITPAKIDAMKKLAEMEKAKENVVWANAYKTQEDMTFWPKEFEKVFNFKDGLFAYEIKAERKKEEKKEEAKKEKEEGEVKFEDGVVKGWVTQFDALLFVKVKGEDNKDYTFYRTENMKVTLAEEGKDASVDFSKIKVNDWVTVYYNKGRYFMESLTDAEQRQFTRLGDGGIRPYYTQLDPILAQVEPMNDKGEGVVQLQGWFYEPGTFTKGELPSLGGFFRYVPQWENLEQDLSEEIWLAQEDLWLQNEIYRIIRMANDSVSRFEGQGGEDKKKEYTFKNPFWEIGVKWAGPNKLALHFKNLQDRRQKLDLQFRVRFHKTSAPEKISLSDQPLMPRGLPGSEKTITVDLKDNPLRKGIYSLEQVLTWETAAVKRIDQISFGDSQAHSQRTAPDGLRPYKQEEEAAGGGPAPMRGGGGPGPAGTRLPGPGPAMGGGGQNRDRYLMDLSPQSRRLPLAVTLIVDQEHIDRVQTAFLNSKLRFLTTQLLLNRYPGTLRPQVVDQESPGFKGGDPLRGMKFFPPPPFNPTGPGPGPAGPAGTRLPGAFKGAVGPQYSATAGSEDDMETNVEMAIYGFVTLYERYPPAKNAEASKK